MVAGAGIAAFTAVLIVAGVEVVVGMVVGTEAGAGAVGGVAGDTASTAVGSLEHARSFAMRAWHVGAGEARIGDAVFGGAAAD